MDKRLVLQEALAEARGRISRYAAATINEAILSVIGDDVAGLPNLEWDRPSRADGEQALLLGHASHGTYSPERCIAVVDDYAAAFGDRQIAISVGEEIVTAETAISIAGLAVRVWCPIWVREADGSTGPRPTPEAARALVDRVVSDGPADEPDEDDIPMFDPNEFEDVAPPRQEQK